jgi:hypothetical protein
MDDTPSQDQIIAQLKARIESLEADVQTLDKARKFLSADLTKCVEALAEAQTEAWDRIKKIELTVFPETARSLVEMNKIVGFSDESTSDLDKRKP